MFEVIIRELYDAGIDCGAESFQGSGIVAWIVGPLNRRIERYFGVDELDRIPEWLLAEGLRRLEIRSAADRSPRELLAELASARRKDAKRVSVDDREYRRESTASNHRIA